MSIRTNTYSYLQILILLAEQGEEKALQEIIDGLIKIDDAAWDIFRNIDGESRVRLPLHDGTYYFTFTSSMGKALLKLAEPFMLIDFCTNRQIHHLIRRDCIRQIGQAGQHANVYIPAFLAELSGYTAVDEVRIALAEASGDLARDEATLAALLAIYQNTQSDKIRDALYTALYKIARRANATIVFEGNDLRVVKR